MIVCPRTFLAEKPMPKSTRIILLAYLLFSLPFQASLLSSEVNDEAPGGENKNRWMRVFLPSYPRSGSHWTRSLFEEAVHCASGSVYIDREPPHMKKQFPWGGYACDHGYTGDCRYPTKKDLVLIKTHYPSQPTKVTPFDNLLYVSAIRLVRHPVDSFYSRYIRKPLGEIQDTVPTERVKEFIKTWIKFQKYWNKKENVITIRYEDMLENPARELRKILDVTGYSYTEEDIARAVSKYPPVGYMLKSQDKFTEEDLRLISKELGPLMKQFGYPRLFN